MGTSHTMARQHTIGVSHLETFSTDSLCLFGQTFWAVLSCVVFCANSLRPFISEMYLRVFKWELILQFEQW